MYRIAAGAFSRQHQKGRFMIVYQAARGFFAMKADAEKHARSEGLKASDVAKIMIEDRDQLAKALNLVAMVSQASDEGLPRVESNILEMGDVPDFVPSFIRADWERRRKLRGAA
jgi:hypothetical protein